MPSIRDCIELFDKTIELGLLLQDVGAVGMCASFFRVRCMPAAIDVRPGLRPGAPQISSYPQTAIPLRMYFHTAPSNIAPIPAAAYAHHIAEVNRMKLLLALPGVLTGLLAAQDMTVDPGNWRQAGISLVSSSDPAFAGLASALVPSNAPNLAAAFPYSFVLTNGTGSVRYSGLAHFDTLIWATPDVDILPCPVLRVQF
jgi:hypothetical protein